MPDKPLVGVMLGGNHQGKDQALRARWRSYWCCTEDPTQIKFNPKRNPDRAQIGNFLTHHPPGSPNMYVRILYVRQTLKVANTTGAPHKETTE